MRHFLRLHVLTLDNLLHALVGGLLAAPIICSGGSGLAVAAVVALNVGLGVLVLKSDAGKRALAFLGMEFGKLKGRALEAFSGIRDALSTGNIKLAAKILWLGLKEEWLRGKTFILEATLGIRDSFIDAVAEMAKVWSNFTRNFSVAWRAATDLVSGGMIAIQQATGQISNEDARAMGKAIFDESVRVLAGRARDKKKRDAERKQEVKDLKQRNRDALKESRVDLTAAKAALGSAIKKAKDDAFEAFLLAEFGGELVTPDTGAAAAGINPGKIAKALTASVGRVLDPVSARSREGANRIQRATSGIRGADPQREMVTEQQKANQKLDKIAKNTEKQLQAADIGP